MTRERTVTLLVKLAASATLGFLHTGIALAQADSTIFTLYRNSAKDAAMRLHVATFDAKEDESYNRENCLVASNLFAAQPGVKVRYFCEKGRFRR
jgi:hypothetical protein